MKCLRWNRGALALILFALAAQASGQALPSPSPLPPEPSSTFRVLQAPKRAVQFNEILDLGTLKVNEQATYDFLLVRTWSLISGNEREPIHVGLSADHPAVQILPSEVTVNPGGRPPFEIQISARALTVGNHVFEIEATDLNDPSIERPFRIQITVLDNATIQDAVSGLYERYRRYTVGSGKPMTIQLSQFETFRRQELAGFGALDLITMHGGQTLEYEFNYFDSSQEGERIVTSPYWRDAGDYSNASWWKAASNMTFLEAIEDDPVLEPHTRATRYQVDVSADGRSRTYTALVLWGGGGSLQFLDYIVPGLSDIAGFEIQPGLSPTLLADIIEERAGGGTFPSKATGASRWTPESVVAETGVRQCEPSTEPAGQGHFWKSDYTGHEIGSHGSRGTVARECSCTEDCVSECKVMEAVAVGCFESGDVADDLVHQVGFQFKPVDGFSATGPAHCAAAVHCLIRSCKSGHCGGFGVTIGLAGGGQGGGPGGGPGGNGDIDFTYSHDPPNPPVIVFDYEQQYPGGDTACPACAELFPVSVQAAAADPGQVNPFGSGVKVRLSAGSGVDFWEGFMTFTEPDPHFLFGHFKQGLTYGIDYVQVNPQDCLQCVWSGGSQSPTIQGPLAFTLTCQRTDTNLSGKSANHIEAGAGQCGGGGGGGSSEYPVQVDARVRCPGCPEGVEPPPMPSLSATLTAAGQASQQITIGGEGTYPFPDPLPNDTDFGVSFSSPSDSRWSCTQNASGRIFGGPAEVYLTCTFNTPFGGNCNLNPAACNPPPVNCQWVWVPFADVPIREVFWESTPDGGTLTEVVNTYTLYWRTIQCSGSATGSRVAGKSAIVGGASAGSTGGDMAPLVVLRNSAQHDFPGPSVPLVGVARDDSSSVTSIQVYVDGQQRSLSGFEMNQLDLHTCDEVPVLVSGRSCNYYSKFSGYLDVSSIGPGTHHISVAATNADGVVGFTEKYLTIAEPEPNEPNALEVSNQPDSVTVFAGEATSWSVTATGGVPPYSYTWEAMGPQATVFEPVGQCCNTSGSTTRTLTLHYAESHYDGSRVRCRIEDSAGNTVTSYYAWLWVGEPLEIAAHPEDVTASAGEDATFSVDVFGGKPPYSYQWMGIHPSAPGTAVEVAGEVAQTLTLESVSSGSSGNRFLCRVTDSVGEAVYSHSALLFVE